MSLNQLYMFIAVLVGATKAKQEVPRFNPADSEIRKLVNEFRDLDLDKAKEGQVVVDYQGHTTSNSHIDKAFKPLFQYVDPFLLQRPTYTKLIALFDNYNRESGEADEETWQEKEEIDAFLKEVMSTPIWKRFYQFLNSWGHPYATNEAEFFKWIKQLWFGTYSRSHGPDDSSGFEHVFVGEAKKHEVGGLHNWVRIYLLERNASEHFDYLGYLVKRFDLMASIHFTWFNEMKRTGSFTIGTSPEFDLAMLTLCFLSRRNRMTCKVEIDGCPLSITSYAFYQDEKVYIGTAYPVVGRMTESCRRNHRNEENVFNRGWDRDQMPFFIP